MKTPVMTDAPEFFRGRIALELPPTADFLYGGCNNMNTPVLPGAVYWPVGFDGEFSASDVIVAGDIRSSQYVLAGAVTAFRSLTYFTLIKRGNVFDSIEVRQPWIAKGETPEEVLILTGSDWRELLKQYADAVARKMGAKPIPAGKNLTGYCSWYYYYASVTEKDFLQNLAAVAAQREDGYPAEVMQIDDGYQTFQGDWLDRDASWPTPLQETAAKVRAAGMTPGIWIMPFQASTASKVFREHPDWFVKDESGAPKVAKGWSPPPDEKWCCLDPTIPAAREHLQNVFRTFWDWGYRYFKMDGLGFALPDGRRHDPAATPVSAFREGLKAIREAVPEAFLLGCCPPFMACCGLVDMVRISNDTAENWGILRQTARVNASRWWMFDRLFRCDPDVVIARQDRSALSEGEARISALQGIMTGVSLTSDNLGTIDEKRMKILQKAVTLRMRDVQPEQWLPARGFPHAVAWPQIFSGTVEGRRAVAVINDDEVMREYSFAQLGLPEDGEWVEVLQNLGPRKYAVTVFPHDAVLLVQQEVPRKEGQTEKGGK